MAEYSVSTCELIKWTTSLSPPFHIYKSPLWLQEVQIKRTKLFPRQCPKILYLFPCHLPLSFLHWMCPSAILPSFQFPNVPGSCPTQGLSKSWFQYLLPTPFAEVVPHSFRYLLRCHFLRWNFLATLSKYRPYFWYLCFYLFYLWLMKMSHYKCFASF